MAHKNTLWAAETDLSKDLSGKTYLITGANSGVGLETTRQLVKQGAHVFMACRRIDAGEEARETFEGLKGTSEVMHCDLADLASVRSFVEAFRSKHDRLDGLGCNAGAVIMGSEAKYSKDGFEMTLAASYFRTLPAHRAYCLMCSRPRHRRGSTSSRRWSTPTARPSATTSISMI